MHFLRRFAIYVVLILIVIVAGILAVQLAPRTFKVTHLASSPQAFWNDHEAFFVSSEGTTGTSSLKWLENTHGSMAIVVLRAMTADWISLGQKQTIRHYADRQLTTTTIDTASGTFVPSGGYLYFKSYSESQQVLRYEHGSFVPAPDVDARNLVVVESDSLDEDSDGQYAPRMPKGWKSAFLGNSTPLERRVEIKLKNAELLVSVPPPQRPDPQAVIDGQSIVLPTATLTGGGLTESVVLNTPTKTEYLTRAEFESRKRMCPAALRYRTPFTVVSYVLLAVLLLVPVLLKVAIGKSLKRRVVNTVPDNYSFPTAIPEQFPMLDRAGLEAATASLQRMGFTHVMDYTATPDSGTFVPGFARLMVHARENVFAEINQLFPAGKKPVTLDTVLVSLFEDNWKLSTFSREPLPAQFLLRRPRALWKSLPNATPEQLWSAHMEMRARMQQELGLRVVGDLSPQLWFAHMTEASAERKQLLKGKSMSRILMEANYARVKKQFEWLGDWPKVAAERARAAGFGQQQ